ncbi:hypothetical protein [Nocardia gipuzkoensis]|uniref:hypothetical protein n=1 Tax=Nocardia gipuzkoensis TaxID=2749991 RepID=UPI001C670090|nr:hypothetical protein [Nocardia gipuzkoensis]
MVDPNIQVPGADDGLPNCAVLNINAFAGYIGTGEPRPTRAMDENFASAPVGDWCNTNVGYSSTTHGPEGVTFVNPPTRDGLFPYNNSEVLAEPVFEPGQTMTIDIKGAPDLTTHNGTAGWGVSNRSIDPLGLEIAWFMYHGSHGFVGDASELTRPTFNVLGQDLPRGFFLMVKGAASWSRGSHRWTRHCCRTITPTPCVSPGNASSSSSTARGRSVREPAARQGRQHPAEAGAAARPGLARWQLLVPAADSGVQRPRAAAHDDTV